MSLKIGFVGCGLIAQSHAIRLRAVDTADIVLAFDIDGDRAASFADKTGARVATSVEQVIEESDAVYVTTWTSEHPHLVSAVAAAGKPIFCEKPLGVDLSTARTMFDEVQAAGKTPMELDAEITRLYAGELAQPEVTVTVELASNQVIYVGGGQDIVFDNPTDGWSVQIPAGDGQSIGAIALGTVKNGAIIMYMNARITGEAPITGEDECRESNGVEMVCSLDIPKVRLP